MNLEYFLTTEISTFRKNEILFYGVTIDTEKQVSLRATGRSDITTGGGTNSHRSDIATESSFSMGEREARSSGGFYGFTLKEAERSDRKVIGLGSG